MKVGIKNDGTFDIIIIKKDNMFGKSKLLAMYLSSIAKNGLHY